MRRSDDAHDQIQLVHVIFPRKERLSPEQLGEDTTDAPHIDSARVLGAREQQLGRAIPPRHDVLRHELGRLRVHERGARQSKVTNLQIAVRVQ